MKESDQLLIGSIPLKSTLDVFTTTAEYFGDNLPFMPDGEFGDRIWWLERVRLARTFFPSFGTSYVCGFGRRTEDDTTRLLKRHREVAEVLDREH